MNITPAIINARVEARRIAIEEALPLIRHLTENMTSDQAAEYWKELRAAALEVVPLPPAPATLLLATPMTDIEARRWQTNTEMPFGQYQGDQINDIAASAIGRRYLRWYADLPFQDELRRYLANPGVARDFQ